MEILIIVKSAGAGLAIASVIVAALVLWLGEAAELENRKSFLAILVLLTLAVGGVTSCEAARQIEQARTPAGALDSDS